MSDTAISRTTAWIATIVAVVAAGVPHAFFAPPLQLHMQGDFDAWLGIAVWSPAILAGVAFFFGVGFGDRLEERAKALDPARRAAGLLVAVIVGLVVMAAITSERWSDMASMRPWDELKTALPLFAALGALRALFFQGFVQHVTLAGANTSARVGILLTLELAIVAPFAVAVGPAVAGLITLALIEAFLGALTVELGYSTRVSIAVRAIVAAAFLWFQQAYLL